MAQKAGVKAESVPATKKIGQKLSESLKITKCSVYAFGWVTSYKRRKDHNNSVGSGILAGN